ncbi:MAG: dCTP deaminase [Patescibacteria group bacterium]|jgi:dCTP deaminase
MVLSDSDIKKFLSSGDIKIDPLDQSMIKGGSYTFTLNNVLFIPKQQDIIDAKDTKIELDKVEIGEAGFVINPGDFLLGQTKEKLSISQRLACILDARTSLARIGLNALQGSTFVEPGQAESHETLEISNIGKSPIKIYPGMKIVKGIFLLLNTEAEQNYSESGTYKKQSSADVISH